VREARAVRKSNENIKVARDMPILAATLLQPSAAFGSSFRMTTPFSVPWVAVIENFDITNAEEDELALLAKDCFLKCPVIVFRKQPETTTAKQFFEFVQKFDPDVDMDAIEKEEVLHPFRREPDAPHVASREENKSTENNQFRWGPVWHMDLVGSKRTIVPNVVSAFHILQVPEEGGNTIYANMDMAYTMLPPDLKKKTDGLKCIYDNDLNSLFNSQLDADGFTRLGPFPTPEQEDQLVRPLVRRDTTTGRKRMFFTPLRFNRFEGWSIEESWELMAYVFHTYVNTPQNTVAIKWGKGDVAVFNNHAMIHTSTPWELYKGKERRFRL